MTTPPKEHDDARQRISELMGPDQDPRTVAHDAAAKRREESIAPERDRAELLARASRRFGMDLSDDPMIREWRKQSGRGGTRYLGSV